MTEHKHLTIDEAIEELDNIYHRTRTSHGFYVPYNIVAALLDKPQVMRSYAGRLMYKESNE